MTIEQVRQQWRDALGITADPDASWSWSRTGDDRATLTINSWGLESVCEWRAPARPARGRIVIPFYDVASVYGDPSPRTTRLDEVGRQRRQWGIHLTERGFEVLVVPWWACTIATAQGRTGGLSDQYGEIAADWIGTGNGTALGRALADLELAMDACGELTELPTASFGHSLGGKLSLFWGALDPRVDAVVSHEPGLGLAHSNWRDPWYVGDTELPADLDALAALVAPRPLLVVGGGDSDGVQNAALVDSTAELGRTHTGSDWLPGHLIHNNGHTPHEPALAAIYQWLTDTLTVRSTS